MTIISAPFGIGLLLRVLRAGRLAGCGRRAVLLRGCGRFRVGVLAGDLDTEARFEVFPTDVLLRDDAGLRAPAVLLFFAALLRVREVAGFARLAVAAFLFGAAAFFGATAFFGAADFFFAVAAAAVFLLFEPPFAAVDERFFFAAMMPLSKSSRTTLDLFARTWNGGMR
jgi:hypothetical protein